MRRVMGAMGGGAREGRRYNRAQYMANPLQLARTAAACVCAVRCAFPPCALADDYSDVNRLAQAKQYGEALAKADQHLAAKPRDPQMHFQRGVVLAETGKRAQAIEAYTRRARGGPGRPGPGGGRAGRGARAGEDGK